MQAVLGGSPEAIRHHYDVGLPFYRGWLDPSLTYSCGLWDDAEDLEEAQARKLDYHADNVRAGAGSRILDIGCGWGSMLRHLQARGVDRAVGLTLSPDQFHHVESLALARSEVRLQSWVDFRSDDPFSGIVSIGAFEHFADPGQTDGQRQDVYRAFFRKCRDSLEPRGWLSLQTIAYGEMNRSEANPFIQTSIFPAAELPTIEDIVVASRGLFEIRTLRNDRVDYARTCEAWASRLRRHARADPAFADAELVSRYHRYLRLSAAGFRMGKIVLLRLEMQASGWATG